MQSARFRKAWLRQLAADAAAAGRGFAEQFAAVRAELAAEAGSGKTLTGTTDQSTSVQFALTDGNSPTRLMELLEHYEDLLAEALAAGHATLDAQKTAMLAAIVPVRHVWTSFQHLRH